MNFSSTKADIRNGKLSDRSIQEINRADELLTRSEELLRHCEAQVGMVLGEQIHEFLSEFRNERFSAVEYHHERMPDGQ